MPKNQLTAVLAAVAVSLIAAITWMVNRPPSQSPATAPDPEPPAASKEWTPEELESQCRSLFPQKLGLPEDSVVTIPTEDGRSLSMPSAYDWRGTIEIESEPFKPNRRPFQCNPQGDNVQIIRRPDTYDPKIDKR